VLEEKDRHRAVIFLAEQKIFNAAPVDHPFQTIAAQTANLLVTTSSDDELILIFEQMRKKGSTGLPDYFLSPLLAQKRLLVALQLLAEESKQASWPPNWQTQVETALTGLPLTLII
jgi:hypothetical protein